ncbi:MAG: hypothetical protein UW91_C0029G0008 [Parcubacteria group bacterium GW2011_GWF2_45_11]|nr:MAG: hypothetical protein UW91_C0029G0008 [Parcubacteria group bacterium GW2011_GWF2_45_11]OGW69894.1 MAG: hypothetical protein A2036_02885 [Omnitrophica bacterium GWA2_50_21]
MEVYTRHDICDALKKAGLKKGDIALVSTELYHLGRLEGVKTREEYYRAFLDAFMEVLGGEGTLAVNAYTTQTGRYGTPFHREKTPATTGAFSQYIASHPGSIRSIHPINSVAAIGTKKKLICENVSRSNYGLDSPFDRMLRMGVQIVRLGLDYAHNVYMHYAEAMYGVPYYYHKLLDIEVYDQGKLIEGEFFAAVRHLEYPLIDDFSKIKRVIVDKKLVHSAKLGGDYVHCIDAQEYLAAATELLKKDPYAFLAQRPDFVKGVKPFDGITAGRDGIEKAGNYKFTNK